MLTKLRKRMLGVESNILEPQMSRGKGISGKTETTVKSRIEFKQSRGQSLLDRAC